jgi:hypothetical protein
MSIWGTGNLENDNAADFMGEIIHQMYTIVKSNLTQEKVDAGGFLERVGEAQVIPAIVTFMALHKQLNIGVAEFEDEDIEDWKKLYLHAYDKEIYSLFHPEDAFVKERREVIVKTFDELAAIVEKYRQRVRDNL